MTENRFRVSDVILLTKPNTICDGDIFLNQKEVCDLLNELSEENEQLKEENKKFKILKKVFEKYCDEYRKQNSLEVVSVLNKIAIEAGLITEKEWI